MSTYLLCTCEQTRNTLSSCHDDHPSSLIFKYIDTPPKPTNTFHGNESKCETPHWWLTGHPHQLTNHLLHPRRQNLCVCTGV